MSTPAKRQLSSFWPIAFPAAVIVAVMGLLYGFLPFSMGYNELRVPVFTFAYNMTKLPEWEHCLMVPFAVLVLVYLDRKKLLTLPVQGSSLGWPAVVIGLLLFWFGYQADVIYFGYISMQLLLAGLILVLFGVRWMLALAFAWMFLVFMWPLLFLDTAVAFPLRIIMSKASNAALNLLGIPSILSGTAILSASDSLTNRAPGQLFSVDVADPCSGIRSLFALMMVSALYAHFAVKGWWRKWILFLCAAPLAVFGNLCRIIMLTIGTIAMGAEKAIGTLENPTFFHMLAGYVVFVVALGGMLLIGALLNLDWEKLFHRLQNYQKTETIAAQRPAPPTGSPQPKPNKDIY